MEGYKEAENQNIEAYLNMPLNNEWGEPVTTHLLSQEELAEAKRLSIASDIVKPKLEIIYTDLESDSIMIPLRNQRREDNIYKKSPNGSFLNK